MLLGAHTDACLEIEKNSRTGSMFLRRDMLRASVRVEIHCCAEGTPVHNAGLLKSLLNCITRNKCHDRPPAASKPIESSSGPVLLSFDSTADAVGSDLQPDALSS